MRISSDLLYRFVRATGRGDARPEEADVEVPPLILPVLTVPGPLRRLSALVTTEVQRESFAFRLEVTRAASQASISTTVCTLGRGLWQIFLTVQHLSDFTAAPGGGGFEGFLTDGTDNSTFVRFHNLTNVSQVLHLMFTLLLDSDLFALRIAQSATGAAQTLSSSMDGLALRLN